MKGHRAPIPQVTMVTTSWMTPVRVSPMYIRPMPSGTRICRSAATSLDFSEYGTPVTGCTPYGAAGVKPGG
jgi:hypothetical protein